MLTIVLIRPGSTDYDGQGRIQGNLDIPLNRKGQDEIAELTEPLSNLGVEAVYAVNCRSAAETGELLSSVLGGCRYSLLERLQNVDLGLWQGMRVDDVKTKQPKVYRQWQDQPETVCPPGGEMLEDARSRLAPVLAKLAKKHKNGAVALVAPEPLASLLRSEILDCELGDLWKNIGEQGTWEVIRLRPVSEAKAV